MQRSISVRQGGSHKNLTQQISQLLKGSALQGVAGTEDYTQATDRFNSVFGGESASFGVSPSVSKLMTGLADSTRFAVMSSIKTMSGDSMPTMNEQFAQFAGTEGFSAANYAGSATKMKAASITLNALAHRQTPAAEALFPTVSIPYQDEQLEFTVRTAGLGRYTFGASAYERGSDLRPVMSLIREGKYFMDDTLLLVPVYPEDSASAERKFFVKSDVFTPVDHSYGKADALGRKTHKTSYLKVPNRIPNLLGLCEAPGQIPFDTTDEIEANSLRINSVLVSAVVGASGSAAKQFTLDTSTMSQSSFGISSMAHSSDDRQLNLRIAGLPASALRNKDGSEADFSALQPNGAVVYFALSVSGNYQRQNNTLDLATGVFDIDYIVDANGVKHMADTDNSTIKALYAQFSDGNIEGVLPQANHTNINRNNFGYRVEVFDAHKVLKIRRQTPVSVRYPVAKEDTNEESLNFAIEQMAAVLNAQTTTAAFVAAEKHFNYVSSISGSAIIGNEQASNVMAGQHFVNATAMHRDMKLADVVSTENSEDAFDNVSAAICNNLTEIAAALATNSGMAAISEYTRAPLKWKIVSHQNLGRYLMRSGDARTLGGYQDFEIELTNIDTMIGKFYIVPKSETTGDTIDPLGGIGVCVSKEHVVVTGNVTRNNKDFGTVMTQASFEHNPLCPVIGLLEILDAKDALAAEGLINHVSSQRVTMLTKSVNTGDNTDTDTDAGNVVP